MEVLTSISDKFLFNHSASRVTHHKLGLSSLLSALHIYVIADDFHACSFSINIWSFIMVISVQGHKVLNKKMSEFSVQLLAFSDKM